MSSSTIEKDKKVSSDDRLHVNKVEHSLNEMHRIKILFRRSLDRSSKLAI